MKSRTPASRLILAAVGALAGLASGLLGVGGGFLIVPLQIMWLKTTPHRAGGTSLAAILPIALVGSAAYYFGRVPGQVDFVVAFFLVIGSTVGAYFGARYVHKMPDRALRMVVAVLLVVVGIDEIASGPFPGILLAGHHGVPTSLLAWQYALITVSGLVIGGLSGITGVGGGIFLVPTLVIGFGLSHHLAQGTSLLAILPTAFVGAATHLRRGDVDVRNAIYIGIAGVPAALVGAALALSLPQAVLAVMFGLLLLFAALRVWPKRNPATVVELVPPQPGGPHDRAPATQPAEDDTADDSIRDRVRDVYSGVARAPEAGHPFKVGRELAELAGYPPSWLDSVPSESIDSFAGVSCVPCFANVASHDRVLDLGCGAGLDSLLVAGVAASVLGIDFSPDMVERASGSAARMGLANVTFKVADAERIPAEHASVDVVLVNGIFNLNPWRELIFSEISRVVRLGGMVFAAELILKAPLPPEVVPSEADWFS